MSNELVAHGAALPLTEVAYKTFTQARIDLILNAKAKGAPLAVFYAFLEQAARYELDPMADEIWLAHMPGRNGGAGTFVPMVGRNGYMKIAKRDRGFLSCAGQAVYENDELDLEIDETGGLSSFKFRPAHPARRGKSFGAFAILRRGNKPSLYFFAPLAQFKKNGGAWPYEDPMIIKCAQSYLLRTTYGVSGPVPWDEISVGFTPNEFETTAIDMPSAAPALPMGLAELVARASAVDSQSWRATEVAARLPEEGDRSYDATVRLLSAELEAWLVENEPTDAVVVDFPDRSSGGTVDVADALQHRWETDTDWAGKVEPLLKRYVNAETGLEAVLAEGEGSEELREQLRDVAAELAELGVPEGWWPELPAGDAS